MSGQPVSDYGDGRYVDGYRQGNDGGRQVATVIGGLAGAIIEPAAYFSKHPPKQIEDREARELVEAFIDQYGHKA